MKKCVQVVSERYSQSYSQTAKLNIWVMKEVVSESFLFFSFGLKPLQRNPETEKNKQKLVICTVTVKYCSNKASHIV